MDTFPTIELLESTHTFPTDYVIKAIGKSERGFLARTVAAVREELMLLDDPKYLSRDAVGGRHISVTLQLRLDSPQQIVAVYQRLAKLEGLVMLL